LQAVDHFSVKTCCTRSKTLSASGSLTSGPGALGPRWGLRLQTPFLSTPHFQIWRRPFRRTTASAATAVEKPSQLTLPLSGSGPPRVARVCDAPRRRRSRSTHDAAAAPTCLGRLPPRTNWTDAAPRTHFLHHEPRRRRRLAAVKAGVRGAHARRNAVIIACWLQLQLDFDSTVVRLLVTKVTAVALSYY